MSIEEQMSLLGKSLKVPHVDQIVALSQALIGRSEVALIEAMSKTKGGFFTVNRPLIGVPEYPDYEREIRHDPLFKELCRIIAFLQNEHTSFDPGHPENRVLAIELLSTSAALAEEYGDVFNLLLPCSVGIDVQGGSASKLIKIGEASNAKIKLALWRPQSFNALPKLVTPSGYCTQFDVLLKSPNSSRKDPRRRTFQLYYK